MIASIIELAEKVPAIAGIIGAAFGATSTVVVWLLVQRRFGSAITEASSNLVTITNKQVEMLQSTLQMQKEHYEAEALETKNKYERDLKEAKARSDDYEKRLHDRRNDWMTEKLEMTNEIASLRERPDLGTIKSLVESQIAQLSGISSTITAIGESLKSHVASDAEMFGKIVGSLQKTLDVQQKILVAIQTHDQKVETITSEVLSKLSNGLKSGKKKR